MNANPKDEKIINAEPAIITNTEKEIPSGQPIGNTADNEAEGSDKQQVTVTKNDLKGKKVDGDPSQQSDQPVTQEN